MQEILEYLRSLPPAEREAFAARCKTSVGYLRKAVSAKQQLGVELCVHLERESGGLLRCERLFPGLDWEYLRRSACQAVIGAQHPPGLSHQAQVAINSEAKETAHA
jgi:DNA-binding transcriptional regulator YdaS (Cro superfamily)